MKLVLNVDDMGSNRFLVNLMINKFCDEITIIDCASGQEALNKYMELTYGRYDVDLVLTDYHMPEMNGYEMSKELRVIGYHKPIIMLTSDIEVTSASFDKHVIDDVYHKPFNKQLIKTLAFSHVCSTCQECFEEEV
jgi:two-component system, chemotaxis family, chemotaxis protein CheY